MIRTASEETQRFHDVLLQGSSRYMMLPGFPLSIGLTSKADTWSSAKSFGSRFGARRSERSPAARLIPSCVQTSKLRMPKVRLQKGQARPKWKIQLWTVTIAAKTYTKTRNAKGAETCPGSLHSKRLERVPDSAPMPK